jgi:hypothetical protein
MHRRLLNLDLLLSIVRQGDNVRFDSLIMTAFKTIRHFNEGLSASAFCKFITESVLPKFTPRPDGPENSLFRFLILLLPVDSGLDLNSESFAVFRRLLDLHPTYAINLLSESLQYRPFRHRPFVWRLLALVPAHLAMSDLLRAEAEAEKTRSAATDPVLHREVSRFLSRLSSTFESLTS